jgi:carboxymethylenebutenolidase
VGAATHIPTSEGRLDAYLAVPDGDGPFPGVVVIHEAFGLTADTRAWTDRLAGEGYVAVAPDLFARGPAVICVLATMRSLLRGRGRAVEDVDAAREFLRDRSDATGKVGVVGFCMGGGFALVAAPRGFDAVAPNYGALPRNLKESLRGACPVVASYGAKDPPLRDAAAKLEHVLTSLDVEHDVKEYPGAGHSFLNRHDGWTGVFDRIPGIGYDEPAAEDAWGRIMAFFGEHLAVEATAEPTAGPAA